ncbi:MAG: hypothetical protein H0W69_03205 [Gemmatimonadaceae bacterium]|nr:hypothetical protein [Gemmatimonadaceae bacterium]
MRVLCALVVLCFVSASRVQAQSSRPFENSWFWGVKAGTLRFATNDESRTVGTVGADWVITRKTGGLYVSFDVANFASNLRVADSNAGGGFRQLEVNGLRRIGVAGMFFPVKYGRIRPYAGLGFNLDLLGDAAVVVDTADTTSDAPDKSFFSNINERRSQIGLMFLGGAQAEFSRLAVFVHASVEPDAGNLLIGRDPLVALQVGLRYNVGTSIDRER